MRVVCERRTYTDKPHAHEHAYAQLVMPVNGALSIALGIMDFQDCHNEVIYIPPLCNHSFYSRQANQFLVFDIPRAFLPHGKAEFRTHYTVDNRWEAIRTLVCSEVAEGKPAASQRIADLSRYIIGLLEPPGHFASVEHIRQYYHTKLSVQELAAIEHYNESYYCEWFQKQIGYTPMEYVRTLRLEKAKQLLVDSDDSLLQIAQEVGYENQATLTKLFRSCLGVSPREFRSQSRKTEK